MVTVSEKLSTDKASGIFLHHTLKAHKSNNVLFHILYEIYVPVSEGKKYTNPIEALVAMVKLRISSITLTSSFYIIIISWIQASL